MKKFKETARTAGLFVLFCVLCIGVGCATLEGAAQGSGEQVDFTLTDIDGARVSLESLRGQVVLLSFWATWCTPCKEEIPILEELYAKYKEQGLAILLINVDSPDKTSEAKAYLRSIHTKMTPLFDPDSGTTSFLNPSFEFPFNLLVDREGRNAWEHKCFSAGDEVELEQRIQELL
jgi:thiol-disulfide isomerase/thioredoxin